VLLSGVPDKASQLQHIFGECLRGERKRQGLSQQKLADIAKISLTYEGELERGQKMPSLDVIVRLANALKLTAAQLLEKSGV
jgi:transcriptional regulator with XRE-family HTH domain